MRRSSRCLLGVLALVGGGCRAGADLPEAQAPQLSRAESDREPPGSLARLAPPAPAARSLASRYVSTYVRIDATTLEKLTGAKRAELFATLPLDAFVYADADLDDKSATEVRGSYLADRFPHKDEPLLLLYPSKSDDRPVVTTADGAEVAVDWVRLAERPTSTPMVAIAPRAVKEFAESAAVRASALEHPNMDSGWVTRALQPLARAVGDELSDKEFWRTLEHIRGTLTSARDANDSCRDRAYAPYDKQARNGTWTATAPSGNTISVKSPAALRAEERGVEQADKMCGSRATLSKKYVSIYDGAEASLRTRLTSERAKFFEEATSRFRDAP